MHSSLLQLIVHELIRHSTQIS